MNLHETRRVSTDAKRYIVDAIDGVADIGAAIAKAVSHCLEHAVRSVPSDGAGTMGAVTETIAGAAYGVADVFGEVGDDSRYIMLGAMKGASRVGLTDMETVSTCAEEITRSTVRLGGDPGISARGAVEGAIAAAESIGVSSEQAAFAAGTGVIRAAREIGPHAVNRVTRELSRAIPGLGAGFAMPGTRAAG